MKKIMILLISIGLCLQTTSITYAKENISVVLDDYSKRFITVNNSMGFDNMLPGETRIVSVDLNNQDDDPIDFYMSASILDNIASKATGDMSYNFELLKDDVSFFKTTITGKDNSYQESLNQNNDLFMERLNKDGHSKISVKLSFDGPSMTNQYMNQEGSILLRFKARNTTKESNVIDTVINKVKTGDSTSITLLLALIGISLTMIFIFIKKIRKS